ncbi:PTS cellobiose transporter subunit IIC [Weissella paramesenteroides]|uniref:PTS cellobiose transporter subunit IIC n=1 Tax=Weissella paramesenteroides TaxID=1249 RepID=UPI00123A76A4|nr:PTS cellobiose transporter subunit IIC [Weissella paramesenteroides]KAA8442492.1 PTS cellobiose transporter subunit IIC [Weissella paramesenteroides]KAA8442839.1 PTS cellobiose transporter subunit IIC [Weissella paramesenteroides]KAA8444486.1 PTS cellobiose transporter subunit IIC [Weissella paramesenteroides]KAA8448153.1 PTS cellobiose transporter subunit IIC [Weissella paramesenteroides]KAA8452035.1 PTS cellobiose transporter subunit IIC [Weissella paramesenteroides]
MASNVLNEKIIPFFQRLSGSRHLVALRDGMTAAVPMIIIGSVFMIVAQFPIQGYQDFMAHTFGSNWATVVQYPTNASFHIMGLVAVAGISYNLAKSYKVDAFSAMVVAIGAFILTIPLRVDKAGAMWVPLQQLDSSGLFIAILVGLFITDLYVWLVHKNLTIKMPSTVPPAVSNSFASLFPGALALILMWIIRMAVEASPMKSIPNIINFVLQEPLSHLNNSLPGAIIVELFICLLWFFGIHGANTVSGVMMPIWLGAMTQNANAMQAGKALPNIVTQQFYDNFVHMGGSGATIGLAFMLAFLSKSKEFKTLGKLVVGPALFNVNEPIIFGMPVVMNYKLLLPFILAPMANVITTYTAMSTGIVAKTMGVMVPWTTPPIISGYLATGHLSGAVLQLVNIVIDGLIYYAFFKSMDRSHLAEEKDEVA